MRCSCEKAFVVWLIYVIFPTEKHHVKKIVKKVSHASSHAKDIKKEDHVKEAKEKDDDDGNLPLFTCKYYASYWF